MLFLAARSHGQADAVLSIARSYHFIRGIIALGVRYAFAFACRRNKKVLKTKLTCSRVAAWALKTKVAGAIVGGDAVTKKARVACGYAAMGGPPPLSA